jgi:hypothetical protein
LGFVSDTHQVEQKPTARRAHQHAGFEVAKEIRLCQRTVAKVAVHIVAFEAEYIIKEF